MNVDSVRQFSNTATSLSRNPLGIIALFIVLVYGLAAFVITFESSLTPEERFPLIYFLVIFPILVLAVFGWLVSRHSGKLFSPSDFKNEENYVRMQMAVVASLTAASAKSGSESVQADLNRIVEVAQATGPINQKSAELWKMQLLWVDDKPENNIYERRAFEAIGFRFVLALNTDEALRFVKTGRFGAIISDMGREEGPREGYVLLDTLRSNGNNTPLFFYSSSGSAAHRRETAEHGGQGCTNDPQELFQLVTRTIIQSLHSEI